MRATAGAGALHVTIRRDAAGRAAATLRDTRPAAAQALRGLPADAACARIPRLYALCARAQHAAAHAALAAATARPATAAARRTDERMLAAEAAREHLWRLMLDWPALLALPAALQADWRTRFAALYRRLAAAEAGACEAAAPALASLADELAAPLLDALDGDLDPPLPAAAATPLLPALGAPACSRRLTLDAAFAAAPTLDGHCRESGALARHHADPAVAAELARGRRIAARLRARVVDLRACARALAGAEDAPRIDACAPAPGIGLACVDSARGLLIHHLRLAPQRGGGMPVVADYLIVAPTEWNFHPRGAFAREALAGPPAAAAAMQRRLHVLALALDPCVAVSWSFEESGDA